MESKSVPKVDLSPVQTAVDQPLGVPEISQSRLERHAKTPIWLREMVAEFFGVFLYVFLGVAATAAMVFARLAQIETQLTASEASLMAQLASRTAFAALPAGIPASNVAVLQADATAKGLAAIIAAARVENGAMHGNVLTVGLAVGLGIAFAIITAAPISGGHFSPAMTILAVTFQGFGRFKAIRYIAAQLMGGLVASFLVYGMYYEQFEAIKTGVLGGNPNVQRALIKIFCADPDASQTMGYMFMSEFFVCFILGLMTVACLDQANPFLSLPTSPITIGIVYTVVIWACGSLNLGLNTAKDFPGRIVASIVIGKTAFTYKSTAWIGTLVNMPALLLAALVYEELFKDDQKHIDLGLLRVAPARLSKHQVPLSPFEHHEMV